MILGSIGRFPKTVSLKPFCVLYDTGVYFCITRLCYFYVSRQDGTNALMAAASNGHLEAAQSLVKAGAALNKQNGDGHNALMFAYNGRAQVTSSNNHGFPFFFTSCDPRLGAITTVLFLL